MRRLLQLPGGLVQVDAVAVILKGAPHSSLLCRALSQAPYPADRTVFTPATLTEQHLRLSRLSRSHALLPGRSWLPWWSSSTPIVGPLMGLLPGGRGPSSGR